jgi:NAD(P)-dependent dehydrogenase (short-subunit alcohol dehydrogenase family)
MNRLTGKIAVITGGNSGIGLETARLFAAEGATVVISGRNAEGVQQAAQAIGQGAIGVVADIAKLADIDHLYQHVSEQVGKIDVLIANAGVFKGAPLTAVTEEVYDEMVDINLKGTFFTIQKALPYLNDGASVMMVSSSGVAVGMNNASVYLATKAATLSLARDMSVELAGRGIRVNVVTPGPVETPMLEKLGIPKEMEPGMRSMLVSTTVIGRMGTPREIANGMLFLASDESSFMMGTELVIDGGMSFRAV